MYKILNHDGPHRFWCLQEWERDGRERKRSEGGENGSEKNGEEIVREGCGRGERNERERKKKGEGGKKKEKKGVIEREGKER